MIRRRMLTTLLLTLTLSTMLVAAPPQATSPPTAGYIPQRVYHAKEKKFIDFEMLLVELARADVVFVGEQHDDFATHRLELAILEGIARRRSSVTVALEMFERDVQTPLNDYLAGKISEADFLKASRPWPNYPTDYRPLIEFAKFKSWPVIAGNVPRRYASQVSRNGLAALDALPSNERQMIARNLECPRDDYFNKFAETMKSHPVPPGPNAEKEMAALTERFYFAQCVKDETMAESIATAHAGTTPQKPIVVHFNGAFHSDYHLGAAARTKRRLEKANIRVVSILPVENLDNLKAEEQRKRGDYLIFTLKFGKSQQ